MIRPLQAMGLKHIILILNYPASTGVETGIPAPAAL